MLFMDTSFQTLNDGHLQEAIKQDKRRRKSCQTTGERLKISEITDRVKQRIN